MSPPYENLHSAITAWDDGGHLSSFEDDNDNDQFSNYDDNDRFTVISVASVASSSSSDNQSSASEEDTDEQSISAEVASLADNYSNDKKVPDMLRTFENCSAKEVLHGKQFRFSPGWVRKALAWCAKNQVSAHCLPRDSKEMIEFMHAVDWNVSGPLLFEALGTKLLSWVGRWITNEKLSPGMIEAKVDPTKVRKADWSSVWAAHTEAWIDVEFEFVVGKTDPKAPKGMEHLPPRAPVPRGYKAPKQLVETAAEFVEMFEFEVPVEKKTITTQKIAPAKKTVAVQKSFAIEKPTVPVQKIIQKTVPIIQQKPVLTHKIIDVQQKTNPFQQKNNPFQQKNNPFQQKNASTQRIIQETVPLQRKTITIEKPASTRKTIEKSVPVQKVITTEKTNPFQQNPASSQKIITTEEPAPVQKHSVFSTQKIITTEKTNPFQQNPASSQKPTTIKPSTTKPTHKPTTTKPTTTKPLGHPPIANNPLTTTHQTLPIKKTKPASPIPTAFFHHVLADGHFIKWITAEDPAEYPLTERQAVEFKECREHPEFLGWWKGEIMAKLKADAIEKEMEEYEVVPHAKKVVKGKDNEKGQGEKVVKEKSVKEKSVVGKGKKTAKTHPVVVKKVHVTRLAARNAAKAAAAKKLGFEGGKSFVEV